MSIKKIKTIPLSTEVVAESYFADMAKDGLFLERVTPFYYEFREDMPKEMDYCVVPLALYQDAEQTRVTCEEKGWHYIGKEGNFYVFGAEKEAAIESEEEKRERYEAWTKKQKKRLRWSAPLAIVSGILGFSNVMEAIAEWQSVASVSALPDICTALIFFGVSFSGFWEFKCTHNLLREMEEGRAFQEGIDWQNGWSALSVIRWLVLGFVVLTMFVSTLDIYWIIGS